MQRPEPCRILPANWIAFQVFLMQERRWRRFPNGELEGLDHAQVESTMRMMRIKSRRQPDTLWRLSVLESAALRALRSFG